MNNYAVVTWSDGTFLVRSEHSDKNSAIMEYDALHRNLIADESTALCTIKLLDSQLNIVDNKYFDTIHHEQAKKSK